MCKQIDEDREGVVGDAGCENNQETQQTGGSGKGEEGKRAG